MKKYLAPFTIVIALAGALFLVSFSKMGQGSATQITNKTKAISTQGTGVDSNDIHLRLRNDYNKAITAYVVSIGNFTYKEEFIYSETDKVIASGEAWDKNIPLPSNLEGRQDLVIQAIVFADKTSDGDQKTINEIEEERLGEKVQLQRILPKLKQAMALPEIARSNLLRGQFEAEATAALNASESDTLTALNNLSPQIATVRQWPNGKISKAVKDGLQTGKASVLQKLQKIKSAQQKQIPPSFEAELAKLTEHYEKVIGRL